VAVYIHHHRKDPDLVWEQGRIAGVLAEVRYNQGRIRGRMEATGMSLREEAQRQIYSNDARTFGACGEQLARMIQDAAKHYSSPLTKERLSGWHAELYPSSGKIAAQAKVHFQASASEGSENRLNKLIHWANSATDTDQVIKAAVAQLWLVVIRPFDAGNERIGELVMEGLLARANQSGERFYSVTGQMQSEAREYGEILSGMQKTPADATPWIEWFLGCMGRAMAQSDATLIPVLEKHRFWARCAGMSLNDRQLMIIKMILDREENKITSSKWAELTNSSQDTASRDINDLVRQGILIKQTGGGRSTSYTISPGD
jgi:predicted transcriptional regulator